LARGTVRNPGSGGHRWYDGDPGGYHNHKGAAEVGGAPGCQGIGFIRLTSYSLCTMIGGDRRGLLKFLYLSVFLVATAIGTPMMLTPVQAEGLGATLLEIGIMGTARNGVIEPLILDFIAHGSPKGSLGATMSFYEFMYGAFTCVSPIVAGYISQFYPLSTTYVGLGLISLLIIPASAKLRNKEKG